MEGLAAWKAVSASSQVECRSPRRPLPGDAPRGSCILGAKGDWLSNPIEFCMPDPGSQGPLVLFPVLGLASEVMSPTSRAPTVPCTCSPTLFPTDRSEDVTAASPHRDKALGWLVAFTSPAPLPTALLWGQDLALKPPGCFASGFPLFILETCRDKSLCLFAALVSPPGDPSLLVIPNIFHHPGLRGAPGNRSRHTGVCLAHTELSGQRSLPYSPAVGGSSLELTEGGLDASRALEGLLGLAGAGQ